MIIPDNYATTFYACIAHMVYWPVLNYTVKLKFAMEALQLEQQLLEACLE